MAEKSLTVRKLGIDNPQGREPSGKQGEPYVMPDEVCCSPEFPQGCIGAE